MVVLRDWFQIFHRQYHAYRNIHISPPPSAKLKAHSPISINIIIKSQLLILPNLPHREYPHPYVLPYRPLRDVAIWVTAVVRESSNTAFFGGVYELLHMSE